ncbi:MAG: glycosyltransferase family 2 protein [bacterium]|nr:glycosyltransferase family 2 protein [bacterium]
MLNDKTIAVVIPAFNEAAQIGAVIETMPAFVDRIVIVNDASTDRTAEIVMEYWGNGHNKGAGTIERCSFEIEKTRFNHADVVLRELLSKEIDLFPPSVVGNKNPDTERIILINHCGNHGVGAAIARGYKWCKDHSIDCTAVMAGDGQMDPDELEGICQPVVCDGLDYVKGNRLIHRSAWLVVPKIRYFGNSILSILTKIASGYWHVSDTQTGYTAISLAALNAIRLHHIYRSYGMPNDMLVKLNIAMCTLKEVPIKPVYNVGEATKMKVLRVIPRISWLLTKLFFKRLWVKYLFRDFHPLFLLYNFAFLLTLCNIPYAYRVAYCMFSHEHVAITTFLSFLFLFISSFQALLFAMWMDMQDNERLYK